MKLSSKMQLGLLAVGMALAGWECSQHVRQSRELAGVEAQVQAGEQELASRQSALAAAEQRNREVVEAEGRAGNERLVALMRERAAATRGNSESAPQTHTFGSALASVLDSPDQQAEKNFMRDQMRANLDLFFRMTKLSPEKIEQYLDLEVDTKKRDSDRTAALLRGSLSVADALAQRDEDKRQQESQRREILGPDGTAFLDGIADGMLNDSAKNLVSAIQQNMGGAPLSQDQSDKLQGLIKTEISAESFDTTDLFRSPADWTQTVSDHQQEVLRGAAEFLTPGQMETLNGLVALDLAQRQKQWAQQRQALGIKNGAQN